MTAMNPEHPVHQILRDSWQTIAVLLVQKSGGELVITSEDVTDCGEQGLCLSVQELADGIHFKIVTSTEAEFLATNPRTLQ